MWDDACVVLLFLFSNKQESGLYKRTSNALHFSKSATESATV